MIIKTAQGDVKITKNSTANLEAIQKMLNDENGATVVQIFLDWFAPTCVEITPEFCKFVANNLGYEVKEEKEDK